jgi:putative hydrolase of the HAD superfamily
MKDGMTIKFIVLDLGGVYLTDGTAIALRKIKRLVKARSEARGEVVDGLFRESPGKEGYLFRTGKLSSEEFWRAVSKKLDVNADEIPKIRKIWNSSYRPKKGMKELVRRLRRNYKVVVLSNNVEERVKHSDKKYGILKEFDGCVFSFEHGMTKGDPRLFEKLLGAIGAKAEECLFIDDKEKFVDVAKGLGMKTILFKNIGGLTKELKSFGIQI